MVVVVVEEEEGEEEKEREGEGRRRKEEEEEEEPSRRDGSADLQGLKGDTALERGQISPHKHSVLCTRETRKTRKGGSAERIDRFNRERALAGGFNEFRLLPGSPSLFLTKTLSPFIRKRCSRCSLLASLALPFGEI